MLSKIPNSATISDGATITTMEPPTGLEDLVDQIWQDVDRRVTRMHVQRLVKEEVSLFQDTVVVKFMPYLIHRRVNARLIEERNARGVAIH